MGVRLIMVVVSPGGRLRPRLPQSGMWRLGDSKAQEKGGQGVETLVFWFVVWVAPFVLGLTLVVTARLVFLNALAVQQQDELAETKRELRELRWRLEKSVPPAELAGPATPAPEEGRP